MLIKTLALYSLVYIAGITSSMAVHQVIPSAGTAARVQSGTVSGTPLVTGQIANRSLKSDRLPIKRAMHEVNDKSRLQGPLKSHETQSSKRIVSRPSMSSAVALQTLG